MRSKVLMIAVAAAFFFAAEPPIFAQAEASAIGPGGRPLTVGAGMSINFLDFSQGSRMEGIYVFVDWHALQSRDWLTRVGIEAEGRDVNIGRPSSLPNMRVDTAQIGIDYTIMSGQRYQFYVKGLGGRGSIDFPPGDIDGITHKTQGIFSVGEGINVHLNRFFSLNVDDEIQVWRKFFQHGSTLTPSAISVGVSHTFGRTRRERASFGQ
ncbi:MAG TPA: hypothetical protein VG225_05985 [Terracidiphilus sp.]|jgi:hypothetical protein|nr:hypothetical protein [Terracidiphilus sp.]